MLALVCAVNVMAQGRRHADDDAHKQQIPLLQGIYVGVDALGAGMGAFSSQGDYQGFVTAKIKGSYLPVVEVGYGLSDKHDDDAFTAYKSKGMFGRIGIDYNMLNNKLDEYRLTIGARYGISKFNSDTTLPTDSLHTDFTTTSEKCTVQWIELVAGVDAKVWGPLHMGWSVRYRRRLSVSDFIHSPQYAPGFGNAENLVNIMALYTISVRF